jgi:hypothetical protein
MKSSQLTLLLVEMMFTAAVLVAADTAPPGSGPMLSFSATTANVMGAPDSIRIDLFRWSTDSERNQLMLAWNNPASVGDGGRSGRGGAPGRGAAAGRGARAGRGGLPGRGGASATDTSAEGNASGDAPPVRIRPSAGDGTPAPTPESALATVVKQTANIGYLWSSEVAGYGIRYAGQVTEPDGAERVILITDRRLGKTNDLWTPVSGTPAIRDFSVIELRIDSKGEGEGKISLTGGVAPDSAAKITALENYAGLPVVLKNVKQRNTGNR